MATFAQIIYMALDALKLHSDDAYYTEEHILFLAKKLRATLLERKYKGSRNVSFSPMSSENQQQVCLQLTQAQMLPGSCAGKWLMSTKDIPALMPGFDAVTCTGHDLLPTNVTFIPAERMPYVGYNKWLRNIVYACRSMDGKLYLHGLNPQFMYLENVGITGVFADPEEAAKLSHEACMTGVCDIMNQKFPLEAALVPALIESIVQELLGSRYAPEDKENNAADDLSEVGLQKGTAPRRSASGKEKPQEQEEE